MMGPAEVAESLAERLEGTVCRLEDLFAESAGIPDGPWAAAMGEFVRLAGTVTAERWQHLVEGWPAVLDLRSRLRPMYGHYLRMQELTEVSSVLRGAASATGHSPFEATAGFARSAYDRVQEMFLQIDFRQCHRFVMVGCGPLPVTILHVADCTAVPELVGLDIDDDALRVAERLLAHLGLGRIRTVRRDGVSHDFSDAGVVYVANMTSPKAGVLRRIADTAPQGTQVIVRDPVAMGNLLAENSAEELDPRFCVVGEGRCAAQFLSKDRYLRLQAAPATAASQTPAG